MSVLVIADDLWDRLLDHLLADHEGRAGFLLAKSVGSRLIVRDIVLIPDDQLEAALSPSQFLRRCLSP